MGSYELLDVNLDIKLCAVDKKGPLISESSLLSLRILSYYNYSLVCQLWELDIK